MRRAAPAVFLGLMVVGCAVEGGEPTESESESTTPSAPSFDLCINEFMPSNEGTAVDSTGDWTDWIELHNPTSEPVDLSRLKGHREQQERVQPMVSQEPSRATSHSTMKSMNSR